jgi:hypothetical protein
MLFAPMLSSICANAFSANAFCANAFIFLRQIFAPMLSQTQEQSSSVKTEVEISLSKFNGKFILSGRNPFEPHFSLSANHSLTNWF